MDPVVPRWAVWLLWFVLGSMLGSFLNVCIWRLPREQSVVRPRSRCPRCEHPIAWYDNVPLASVVALRGRCRHCHGAIAWRYPLVEALTGCLTVAILARFGTGPVGLIYLAFTAGLIVATFVDFDFRIIPDEVSLGGLAAGLVASGLVPSLHGADGRLESLGRAVAGALVGGGLLYGTGALGSLMLFGARRLGVRLRRNPYWRARLKPYRHQREAMGLGDVKLLAMAGAVLGWKAVALTFLLSPLLAIVPGLLTLAVKRSHVIPYGPFLSLGLVVSLFYGDAILRVSGLEETVRLLWEYYR